MEREELFEQREENVLLTKTGMSRRDALKLMGISPVAASVLASTAPAASAEAVDVKGKIVIVGGGSGAIMALVRLHRAISDPDITIIAPNEVHLYQPGQIFMAAGLYTHEDIVKPNSDFIPDDVTWIKDEVAVFDPDNNRVTTRGGEEVAYDYLVVATGIVCHYDAIKGLTEADIGTNGISSVYLNNPEAGTAKGGEITWEWFNDLKEAAKNGRPKVIYTQPNTPIKCGGAPQKILYLSADYLKKEGLSADYAFTTSFPNLFFLKPIADALGEAQQRYDSITNYFSHHLESIDVKGKVATYVHAYDEQVYDEDLEEYETVSKSDRIEMPYDFIHIVPPMSPPDAVVNSPLAGGDGWLEVDKYTLQHPRFPNVFGIGDVCGIPMGKTGGSARHHGPVLQDNLLAVMQGKTPKEKFDGYTVCPLKTQYGEIIMAEFNYEGFAPTIPFLAPEKPRMLWWYFDVYMLKPMYWYLMLRGLM
ncbi:FAD/NAD(P)-binding oxidoreductase [Sulfurimonas sp. HSL-1656]|uniref:NAD(P)/FAD-dependent oxidoreductase n=1 Tax=Thiomicrolovo subterrani TaxID=3131934 RepID=UPI0031F93BA2